MDHIVDIIVRLCASISGFIPFVPFRPLRSHKEGDPISILLVGYNGARNTGADVRVAALMSQLNNEFGTDRIRMSLMSLDPPSTQPYLTRNAENIPFDTIFFLPLLKACSEHEVIILCEGSMLKSKFANGLTLFLCEAAGIAKAQRKPCIAYGVEAGYMDDYISRTSRKLCSDVSFIARTEGSRAVINALGMDASVGTDTAWTFDSAHATEQARQLLLDQGWDGKKPLLGVAAINPFCWPAKPSLGSLAKAAVTGKWDQHYQKWYFFSWSQQRAQAFSTYLQNLARTITTACEDWGFFPVIIGMEKLDREACVRLGALIKRPHAKVLAEKLDGYTIAEVIGQLDTLITSRYHAGMLAIKQGICPIAVSMDERLQNLFEDAGISRTLLFDVSDPRLDEALHAALDEVKKRTPDQAAELAAYVQRRTQMCATMAHDTAEYLAAYDAQPACCRAPVKEAFAHA